MAAAAPQRRSSRVRKHPVTLDARGTCHAVHTCPAASAAGSDYGMPGPPSIPPGKPNPGGIMGWACGNWSSPSFLIMPG